MKDVTIVWLRRDLRLEDNTALTHALEQGENVLPLFIFDAEILRELPADDARVTFIHEQLTQMNAALEKLGGGLHVYAGTPQDVWDSIALRYNIKAIYYNRDYEPYATIRDAEIGEWAARKGILVNSFKDQVVFEADEVLKKDGVKDPVELLIKFRSFTRDNGDSEHICNQFYSYLKGLRTKYPKMLRGSPNCHSVTFAMASYADEHCSQWFKYEL